MAKKKSFKAQGNKAEKQVSSILRSLGVEYYVFDNVMFKTKKGTTQIDHIVVSPYGVFVIETKSHKGLIFGDCNAKYWTQSLYSKKGITKYQFYSPYYQNVGHMRHMCEITGLSADCMFGIICFTSPDVNLSNVYCNMVTYMCNLYVIFSSYRRVILTPNQVSYVRDKIIENNIQSAYFDKKHVKYVKSMK